ncbi:MAG: hypothetical protein HWD85_05195 [Flavobacteriaceae bacterium]|nr:hypothetical protein [Flavobacteriaceae bacterium]
MKKIIFISCIILISCSKDNQVLPSTKTEIIDVTPKRVKYGDTITLTGKNLHKGIQVNFMHENTDFSFYNRKSEYYNFISHNDVKSKISVPQLTHHKINLKVSNSDYGNDEKFNTVFNLDYYGIIALKHNRDFFTNQYQVINHNLAFGFSKGKIYKSTNGFYNWDEIYSGPDNSYVSSIYYLDQNNFWACISEYSTSTGVQKINMYYSINEGKDFKPVFQIGSTYSSKKVRKMKFFSNKNGYYLNDNNEMFFVANNKTIKNIYDHFPDLSTLPFGRKEIADFIAIHENLIYLTLHNTNYLVKIDHGKIIHNSFNQKTSKAPSFFNNIGYLKVENTIYKSENFGDTWNKIYEGDIDKIKFFNKNTGILFKYNFINVNPLIRKDIFFRTTDGGKTWIEHSPSKSSFIETHKNDPTDYSWLIDSKTKYIE